MAPRERGTGEPALTRYMVIESFAAGRLNDVYQRFHAKGRMLPEGLHYIESWLSTDGRRCFQLMETEDPSLFGIWEKSWQDLVEFEVVELGEKPAQGSEA
jgi:Protein of unknown function (DUF3303)